MHVNSANEVPEYEINPDELDFTQSKEISNVKTVFSESFTNVFSSFSCNGSVPCCIQGTYCMAMWRGIQVAVKKLDDEVLSDEEQV